MPRVCVTGAHGLLGSALVPYLQSRGYDVIIAPGRPRTAESVDLLQSAHAQRVLDAVRPDFIVNLAALTDVDYCETHPDEAYRVNAGLVLNLVQWIESASSPARLIQISTDQVYEGEGPHVEARICPTNFYGYSKCLAEEYVRRVAGTSLRTNFFGRSAATGRKSFSDWIVAAIRAQQSITVFDDVFFSPLALPTLVQSIELVMRKPKGGVFNLGSSGGMSKANFAFQMAEAAGLPTTYFTRASVASRSLVARRPRDMRMNSQAFAAEFDAPEFGLTDEIDRVARGYRDADR